MKNKHLRENILKLAPKKAFKRFQYFVGCTVFTNIVKDTYILQMLYILVFPQHQLQSLKDLWQT